MKLTQAPQVEAGQDFAVERFRPEDAIGVAGLFLSVYGDGYPQKQYYDPEWLIAANASNEVVSVVARTAKGDIVSHMAVYRGAAPNPRLYELGIGLTLPQYRGRQAAGVIAGHLVKLLPSLGLDGAFGEAVCNHTVTQKIAYAAGFAGTAVEFDLMPAGIYDAGKSAAGRVTCLFSFLPLNDPPQTLYVPEIHQEPIRFILEGMPEGRTVEPAALTPQRAGSRVTSKIFDFASVSRCQVMACGEDIAAELEGVEREAARNPAPPARSFSRSPIPALAARPRFCAARAISLAASFRAGSKMAMACFCNALCTRPDSRR